MLMIIKFAIFTGIRELLAVDSCREKFVAGAQPAFTCSNLTIETLEQSVKYVQS